MAKTDFENEPSDLDDLTHQELLTMHQNASSAILFAKSVQWFAVGFALTLLFAAVILVTLSPQLQSIINLISVACILLACGTIFILIMHQMWQFNEIRRIRRIEQHFSTLSRHVNHLESRGERNVERYTMLFFMILTIIATVVIALIAIR